MSRIPTQPTIRMVKPFISPQAFITTDNRPLSEVIILSFFMNDNPSKDTCSIAVIMIVTSMQTDRQSIYLWCLSQMAQQCDSRPMGDSDPKAQTHKATRKFHAIWCLSSSCLSSIMNTSSMNDESSILYPIVFPLDCHVGIVFLSY